MKTKLYIAFILILSVSVAQAQSDKEKTPVQTTTATEVNIASNVGNDLVSPAQLKESIARTNSDIRVYFNRVSEKKVENIKLLFPKIHKAKEA